MNERGPFRWTQLDLPAPLNVETARAALTALAGMSGHPRIVLEARGENRSVRWYLGAEAATARRAITVMSHHLTGLRSRQSQQPAGSVAAAAVRVAGHKGAQLNVGAIEAASRGVLGALAGANEAELVRLQVIVGPRHRPRQMRDVSPELRSRVKAKYGEHRVSCEVRIGAKAEDEARARRLIQNVAASLRALESPGLAIRLKRSSLRALDEVRDPFLWRLELGVSEVAAILGWPVAPRDAELPGVPSPHPRLLPVASSVPTRGRVLGVATLEPEQTLAQGIEEAKRVTHIMGPMGVGKSVLMTNLALQDANEGRAIVLVDAKGDSLVDFAARLDPKRHADVVWIDPTDAMPVGIDVFRGDPERQADVVYGVFRSLYGDALGPRSSDLLHAGLLTLARAGNCTLSMLPLLFSSPAFRRRIAAPVGQRDLLGLGAVWSWFEGISDAERVQVVAPIRNKLDPVLSLRPGLRAMFGQANPKFSFHDLFVEPGKRPIVLVNLGTAELGPEGARTMGSVLLALIWQAAQARVRIPESQRHPVMLYLDEFQEIVRLGDLADAMARARGLGVAFTVGHQGFSQVSPSVKAALLSLARSRICFQLSPSDAKEIAATTNGMLTPRDFQELPAFSAYASLLVGGDRAPWCSMRTRPLPVAAQDAGVIRALSRERYGRPIAEVEAELLAVAGFGSDKADESFGRSRRSGGVAP